MLKIILVILFHCSFLILYPQHRVNLGLSWEFERNGTGEIYEGFVSQPPAFFISYEAGYSFQINKWLVESNLTYKECNKHLAYRVNDYQGGGNQQSHWQYNHSLDMYFNYLGVELKWDRILELKKGRKFGLGFTGIFEGLLSFKESNYKNNTVYEYNDYAPPQYTLDTIIYYPETYEKNSLFIARQYFYKLGANFTYFIPLKGFFIEPTIGLLINPYKRVKYVNYQSLGMRTLGFQVKMSIGYTIPSKNKKGKTISPPSSL